jgi:DNA (cytosine-5)-methyltransferase 3A
MIVLSLFDGMSCGQLALKKSNIKVEKYYASEIKQHAIKCTQHNFPDTIQLGDIRNIKAEDLPQIDLLIGGSPCQDFSIASKDRKGLEGEKSSLFFEYLRLFKECKPKYFLLENVEMTKENKDALSEYLGAEPIFIDSIDFSFQTRKRYYWTNISVKSWTPKKVNFQDYKDNDYEYCKQFKVKKTPSRITMWEKKCPNVTNREYVNCLTLKQDRWNNSGLIEFEDFCRYLTRREMELAQTVPVGYTDCLSIRQAEDLLGDGWTIDVIAHIFSSLA